MNAGVSMYTLQRISQSEEGTFGQFLDPAGNQLCVTCEPSPDSDHPCVPSGIYQCIPHNGTEWKNVWEITGVPGRTAILIHAGNDDADTAGCVCVGTSFGWIGTSQAVMESLNALNKLRSCLPNNFILSIMDVEITQ
jgi:Family of unknown function (DUF5675)